MTFQTPRAFLAGLCLHVAQNSRSKCKLSGANIVEGELIVDFTLGGARSEKPTVHSCSLKAASPFIASVAKEAGGSFPAGKMKGFKLLSREMQQAAVKVMAGGLNSSKRPAPASPGVKKSALKTKKVKA